MEKNRKAPDAWRKEQQDPQMLHKMELVGDVLLFVSVGVALGFFQNLTWPWLLGCLACLLTAFILSLTMPVYFTLMSVDKEALSTPRHGVSLLGVVCFPGAAMMSNQYYQVQYDWKLLLATAVLLIVVMGLLFRFRPERMDTLSVFLTVALVGICGYSTFAHANALLDFSQPEHVQTTVLSQGIHSGGRGRSQHVCTVVGVNGEEITIEIPEELYSQIECNDAVCLDIHPGALGIEYVDIHLQEQ